MNSTTSSPAPPTKLSGPSRRTKYRLSVCPAKRKSLSESVPAATPVRLMVVPPVSVTRALPDTFVIVRSPKLNPAKARRSICSNPSFPAKSVTVRDSLCDTTKRSKPSPPVTVLAPVPPERTSSPSPPVKTSFAVLPVIESLKVPPVTWPDMPVAI